MSALKIAVPVKPGAKTDNYLDVLERSGAEGTLIYGRVNAPDFAGLLLPGGWDLDPALYGQANVACLGVDRALDELQWQALKDFISAGKPVLGVCRGLQLVNIYFGGTLIQHLPTAVHHSRDEGVNRDKAHLTRALPDSFLGQIYGAEFAVNSSHHQAIDAIGEGLRAVQWSDDGIVEGVAHVTLPIWGVQWHPERMCFARARCDTVDGAALFHWFLNECQRRL